MNRFLMISALAALTVGALAPTAEAKGSKPWCGGQVHLGYAYVMDAGDPWACAQNYKKSPSWLSQGRFQYQKSDGNDGWKMIVLVDATFKKH